MLRRQYYYGDVFSGWMDLAYDKRLTRLFRDNIWKLYGLLESMISNSSLQFSVNFIRKLNRILGIEK